MHEQGKLAQVEAEMARINLKILGLSETRWTDFGEIKTTMGITLIFSGRIGPNNAHTAGVGFLINKKCKGSLLSWQPISERIIMARFATRARQVTIIRCYAPTENADEQDKDNFYGSLLNAMSSIKKKDIVILMGDINGKVGSDNYGLGHVIGTHGVGVMNDNGERFIDFCENKGLIVGGTIFPHKTCHKISWVSPDKKNRKSNRPCSYK